MKENEELREAGKKLEEMSEDEYMQRIADLREKAILDKVSSINYAKREGKEEGIKQGIEQGIKQGRKEGMFQGEEKAKIEIAKKLKEMNMTIEKIVEATGLSREQIEEL